ncbi:MAG: ARMT1-like domain-containing protein [Eubacteriales bacterium]
MELFLDCLPCMHRQALEAAYESTDDISLQEKIMDDTIKVIADYKKYDYAPELCRAVHRIVKHHTHNNDPYRKIKDSDINEAKKLEYDIRNFIKSQNDILKGALKASATGNVMDTAIFKDLNIKECIKEELNKEFKKYDIQSLKSKLKNKSTVLIIGDNSGEGVFDKILIEILSNKHKVTFAYRSEPIINDITKREVDMIGIGDYAHVLSTGCSAPGALANEFSREFKKVFYSSDIVISKGQGNFEALSEVDRNIYFLLKAKCPKIAKALGVEVGDYVFELKR